MNSISVSIVTYVAVPHARKCIKALLEQKGVTFDLILTANGSPPAAAFFHDVERANPGRVRVVENETNEGFIRPSVKALSMVETPFFLLLNDDTQLSPRGLQTLLAPFNGNPDMALVGVAGGCCQLDAAFEGQYGSKLEYVEGACLMCRTEVVKKLGLFDPMLRFAYCEDADLSLRVRQAGYQITTVPLDIQHKRGATSRYVPGVFENRMANQLYCAQKWSTYLRTRRFDPVVKPSTPTAPAVEPEPAKPTPPVFLDGLTVVTCTGDRPEAFALAEKYMARQTVKPAQWLVLDDGTKPLLGDLHKYYYYLPNFAGPGSMIRKLKYILDNNLVLGSGLVFWEDDDWYAPTWLAMITEALKTGDVVGEGRAVYYNVHGRWWHDHGNMGHASLCETAVSRKFFPILQRLVDLSIDPYLDNRIWRHPGIKQTLVDPTTDGRTRLSIGIKGMPGRKGYGTGHNAIDRGGKRDPGLKKLTEFIGSDADLYAGFSTAGQKSPPR